MDTLDGTLHFLHTIALDVVAHLDVLVAVHANTYGIYPSEIAALQKDYADLWEPLSELLKKLSAVVSM